MKLLDIELQSINFDMSDFGFEFKPIVKEDSQQEDEEEQEEKENERHRTMDYYNLYEFDEFDCDGFYQMPIIYNDNTVPDDLVDITSMNVCLNPEDFGMHMFVDDYRFEQLWNSPHKYLAKLSKFKCVFTPDFSFYLNVPMAMKVCNIYRSRLLGQMCKEMESK